MWALVGFLNRGIIYPDLYYSPILSTASILKSSGAPVSRLEQRNSIPEDISDTPRENIRESWDVEVARDISG
jgi:hypothetical protein